MLENQTTLMIICAIAVIGALVYMLIPRRTEADEALDARLKGKRRAETDRAIEMQRTNALKKALEGRMGKGMASLVTPTNEKETNAIKQQLIAAGWRQKEAFTLFMTAKFITGTIFLTLGLTGFLILGDLTTLINRVLLLGGAFAIGFIGPSFWLSAQVSTRQRLIRNGLPDALDLLVVCVEAGLALDAALQKVADELRVAHPALCEEFSIAIIETNLGRPRSESLQNMASRTGVEEVRNLVGMIIQAEKFGTSIGKTLRNQSEVLRVKRRQRAEEKAAQCAVKLLLPLIFFIFPALFIVLAGPGGIKIYQTFVAKPM